MFDELFHQRGLSFERLNALVQLSESGSLIRAANGDAGLQSRYSHHLKELSAYFGVELTERNGKTIRLTAVGEKLVTLSREHFQSLLQFRNEVQGVPSRYRLGAGDSMLQWLVIPTVASLRRASGNVRFELRTFSMEEIISRLHDQRLDFGLVTNDGALKGLTAKPVCRIRYIVVVPDRLSSRRGTLSLKQALLECPHAAHIGDSGMRSAISRIAHELGAAFEPELQCESVSQCVSAVMTGQFAAILPRWSWDARVQLPHEVCEDPKLARLDQRLLLAWHPRLMQTRGSSARSLMSTLLSRLGEESTNS